MAHSNTKEQTLTALYSQNVSHHINTKLGHKHPNKVAHQTVPNKGAVSNPNVLRDAERQKYRRQKGTDCVQDAATQANCSARRPRCCRHTVQHQADAFILGQIQVNMGTYTHQRTNDQKAWILTTLYQLNMWSIDWGLVIWHFAKSMMPPVNVINQESKLFAVKKKLFGNFHFFCCFLCSAATFVI